MLLGVRLPKSFRGKASDKATYLIARCSFIEINFKITTKVWSRKPIDYSNLKVSRERVVKHVFIDYLEGVKGYKLWKV